MLLVICCITSIALCSWYAPGCGGVNVRLVEVVPDAATKVHSW